MTVRIACGLSTAPDPRAGAVEAAATVAAQLHGANVDLAVVFASGAHLAAPEATIESVHEVLEPDVLIGCGAGGIVGGGREIEGGTAVTVWAASFADGAVSTFHAEVQEVDDGLAIRGVPDLRGAGGAILLPDPYSFPTDAVLSELHERSPGVPVLGGVSSARTLRGEAALFLGEEVVAGGAVGVRFDGVELLPCVSQGATPIGPELTITAGEGRIIHELAGRPALAALRSVIEQLGDDERRILAEGMLLGIVLERGRPDYLHGDFLVRSVLGGDPETGTIAVGAPISAGQVVRVHARDAASADRDLHDALGLRRQALGSDVPAGALIFTCNGRGRGMFGVRDHDAAALAAELGAIPTAGFFAAGEIGPVGGESFLHGFTATVAVFAS
ncbi:MAG TPA: FIST N-terminal domain-containing protein [Solirubrobacteraceae bacterium]|jgi:small ligand-binding sensory domain FIST|nr:FIST N-terminal domain-containing protein [Solirubrobacteraceae bacterium]